MMEYCRVSVRFLLLAISIGLLLCLSPCDAAYTFYVGGKDGWVLKPSEDYNKWAERNRFQINDTLVFKYEECSNSVLVVNQDDYNKCNKDKPIQKFTNGHSVFKFDRSGPFFFISGHDNNCDKGQKLEIIVLSPRNHHKRSPPPVPSPQSKSPAPEEQDVYHQFHDAPAPAPSAAHRPVSYGSFGFLVGFSLLTAAGGGVF